MYWQDNFRVETSDASGGPFRLARAMVSLRILHWASLTAVSSKSPIIFSYCLPNYSNLREVKKCYIAIRFQFFLEGNPSFGIAKA
jgi:hypothetical protein